jgi:uncharacterized membrane protein YbhN (UPF0104 family)
MKKRQAASLAIIALILAALAYLQFRSWRSFDWARFRQYTGGVSLWHIAAGVALIYLAYVLRAIRWAIFLKPTAPTRVSRLIAPQIIGFAALGLFGRAGEFARPYLIARKEKLTFTSQLAVWTVERFFDLGAVAALVGGFLMLKGGKLAKVLAEAVHRGVAATAHNAADKALLAVVALAALGVLAILLKKASGRMAEHLRARLVSFKQGFNTIHDAWSFVQLVVVSIAMWLLIASSYIQVLHSYPQIPVTRASDAAGVQRVARMNMMKLDDVLLVMGSSILGSVVQLPGGVGGSQLAVIGVLQSNLFSGEPYNITPELAVSCGIMLWLVTFMSVVPAGVLLARFEKISFSRINKESAHEEKELEAEEARASPGHGG